MSYRRGGRVGRAEVVGLLALLLAGGAWAGEAPQASGPTAEPKTPSHRVGSVPPAMQGWLDKTMTLEFSGICLLEATDFLHQVTGLNMVPLPPRGAGVEWARDQTPQISIKRAPCTLSQGLDLICDQTKLAWTVDGDTILIGPRARMLEPRPRVGIMPEKSRGELATMVPVPFTDTPVEEIVDFYTQVVGSPFVLVQRDLPPRSATVTINVSTNLAHGLDLICEQTGLAWGVVDGKVTIGKPAGLRRLIPPPEVKGPVLAIAEEVEAMPEPYRSAAAFPTDEDVANTRKTPVSDEELRGMGASLAQVLSGDLLGDKSLHVLKQVAAAWEDEAGVTQFARYSLMASDRWLVQVKEGRGRVYVAVRRAGEGPEAVPKAAEAARAVLAAGLAPASSEAVELKPVSDAEKLAGVVGSTGAYGALGPLPKAQGDAATPPDGRVSLWTDGRIVVFLVTRGPQPAARPAAVPKAAPSPVPDPFS